MRRESALIFSLSTVCSMRLRITYSLRSKRARPSAVDTSIRAPMKTCWNTGCVARAVPHQTVVRRDVAPAEQRLPFLVGDPCDQILDPIAIGFLVREEDEADTVRRQRRQRERH